MNQILLTSSPGTLSGEMLYRTLGRAGERISAIGLGGFHIGKPSLTDDDSIRLIRTAIGRHLTEAAKVSVHVDRAFYAGIRVRSQGGSGGSGPALSSNLRM